MEVGIQRLIRFGVERAGECMMAFTYRVGAAKADIADRRPGLIMDGYAYEQQASSGNVDVPLYARAFAVEEAAGNAKRALCLVVIDAWSVAEPIKTQVLKKLPNRLRTKLKRQNLVISATHTHSGPGGYAHYYLYNITTGGHDLDVLDKMVAGIVKAIITAFSNLSPGHVYWSNGPLTGCGDNRSIAAYRANPEARLANAYDLRTDTDMTVLKFTQGDGALETEIGIYSLFAIHPTSMGMYNVDISGDNKGLASVIVEQGRPPNYVAAFANANAGDVSPNVVVHPDFTTSFRVPMGGPGDVVALAADRAAMRSVAQRQADFAMQLAAASSQELTGRLSFRATHVDMTNVRIGSRHTAKAAVGVSFAAGSHEDSIGLATFSLLAFAFDFKPEILEGMNLENYAAGRSATEAIVGPFIASLVEDVGSVGGVLLLAPVLLPFLASIRASGPARSWVFGNLARALFPGRVESDDPQNVGTASFEWNVPADGNWPASYVSGQGSKPIIFPVGITELVRRRNGKRTVVEAPLVPHVIPLQIFRIGSLAMAAVPAEFTTVAGRRLKARIKRVFGASASHVAMIGYANDYAFYVTTPEEYRTQHYEGASTVFGPHTLAAYLQEMERLAIALRDNEPVATGLPVSPVAIYYKN
jgi:hypothetical protein